ncbi:MAG: CDP-glucose 4,6-dehydratase [Actinomycetes bacterium]
MRLFLTGHTGFKGSWFAVCAARAGHDVYGYAQEPLAGGFFEANSVADECTIHTIADLRDRERLELAIEQAQPDMIVHMAAQALVRRSYREPRETIDVNVIGTLNVLEAAEHSCAKDILVITSDKVYRNVGSSLGYSEDAALGGHDPYSASKAMAEILVGSWANSFPVAGRAISTARAGNVIGGGDRCEDRLLPDIVNSVSADGTITLRYPQAVRPWQHVLDVTSGYFAVLRRMRGTEGFDSWNLGPDPADRLTVAQVTACAIERFGTGTVEVSELDHPHEAVMLTLDASKARKELGWEPLLSARQAVEWTVDWERSVRSGGSARAITEEQISSYEALAATGALVL